MQTNKQTDTTETQSLFIYEETGRIVPIITEEGGWLVLLIETSSVKRPLQKGRVGEI